MQDEGQHFASVPAKNIGGFIANAKPVFLPHFTPKKTLVLLTMKLMVTAMTSTLMNNFLITSRLNR
jgi:hypothetical protein